MSPDCFHDNPSSNLISSRDLKSGVTPGSNLLKAPEGQELRHAANFSFRTSLLQPALPE
jgi:hypothetical protein